MAIQPKGLEGEEYKPEMHQVYRDLALLNVTDPKAAQIPDVDAYISIEYLQDGWTLKEAIPCGIRNIGEDARNPRLVLGMLYVLVR